MPEAITCVVVPSAIGLLSMYFKFLCCSLLFPVLLFHSCDYRLYEVLITALFANASLKPVNYSSFCHYLCFTWLVSYSQFVIYFSTWLVSYSQLVITMFYLACKLQPICNYPCFTWLVSCSQFARQFCTCQLPVFYWLVESISCILNILYMHCPFVSTLCIIYSNNMYISPPYGIYTYLYRLIHVNCVEYMLWSSSLPYTYIICECSDSLFQEVFTATFWSDDLSATCQLNYSLQSIFIEHLSISYILAVDFSWLISYCRLSFDLYIYIW